MLVQAGYRGQAPYVTYSVLPHGDSVAVLVFTLVYVFVFLKLDSRRLVKVAICIAATYLGMQLPSLFLKNRIQHRQLSISERSLDALDLLLICVESGMSIEAGLKRVAAEVGTQSIPLAEELTPDDGGNYPIAGSPSGLRKSCQAHRL